MNHQRIKRILDFVQRSYPWWGATPPMVRFWRAYINLDTEPETALGDTIRTVGRQDSSRGIG